MPPNQSNPYDFIVNQNTKRKRNLNIGKTPKARFGIVLVGLIFIILLAVIFNSFLNKDSNAQSQRLIEIAQAQSEIIRISAIGKDKATEDKTKNYAAITRYSIESSQKQVKDSLVRRGNKEKGINKQLTASKNPKTDAALDEAAKNNRFDDTFLTIMNKQLVDYQKLLKGAYDTATPNEKKMLTDAFNNAGQLTVKQTATQPAVQ